MILGAKYWNADRALRFHVQTNNPTEEQLRKDELEEGKAPRGWLETCGPTSAVNGSDAVSDIQMSVTTPGGYSPQPEEVLADYFNDPANYEKFDKVRGDLNETVVQGNRIPNLYPLALREVFGVRAEFYLTLTRADVIANILAGRAVMVCLKNPGHYIAAVAYDTDTDEIIYHDSWPARTNTDGYALRMGATEYAANVQDCAVVIYGGKA